MDSLWFIPEGMRVGDPSEDMIGAVCEFVEVTERFPDGSPKAGVCEVKRWTDLPGGLEMDDRVGGYYCRSHDSHTRST